MRLRSSSGQSSELNNVLRLKGRGSSLEVVAAFLRSQTGVLSMDIVVLAITVIFFALLFGYVRACEQL